MLGRLRRHRAQRRRERAALTRLAEYEAHQAADRRNRVSSLPSPTHVLAHIEGAWEVPVAWVDHPGQDDLVVACAQADGLPQIEPGTLFSLTSSRFSEAKLSGLSRRGWALVQAWPLAAAHVLAAAPGYQQFPGGVDGRYLLCVIRSRSLAGQGHDVDRSSRPPAPDDPPQPRREGGFEALA